MGWKIRVVDDCDIDNNSNRKVDVAEKSPAPFRPAPKEPLYDDIGQREYDYEDDAPSRVPFGNKKNSSPPNNLNFGPEHRAPTDNGFFPDNPFKSNFPPDFGDFFKGSPFGREEERPTQRPTAAPAPVIKPVKVAPIPKPTEAPLPAVVKAEEPKPTATIPGPLKQLNKLINHASNYQQHQQQPNLQNHQPPRAPVERPIQPPRPKERPAQEERPAQSEQQNHNYNPKEKLPTKIVPPPVQLPNQQAASATTSVVQRPFYHHQTDPNGGVFNPSTIILESGFKPIRNSDGPVPPLGFDVEPQVAKGIVLDDDPRVVTSESPNLVTLDPVFIASEPDHRRIQEPVPITLPKAVVPVVPGPAAPVPQFPPHHPNHQAGYNNPLLRHPQTPTTLQRQQVRPPQFNGQDPNTRSQLPHPPPPSRKKTSGLASIFNFGSQRRRENHPHPPAPQFSSPAATGPSPPR